MMKVLLNQLFIFKLPELTVSAMAILLSLYNLISLWKK